MRIIFSILSFLCFFRVIEISIFCTNYHPVVKVIPNFIDHNNFSGNVNFQDTKYDIYICAKSITENNVLSKAPDKILRDYHITPNCWSKQPISYTVTYTPCIREDLPWERKIVTTSSDTTFKIGSITIKDYYVESFNISLIFNSKVTDPNVIFCINDEYFNSYSQNSREMFLSFSIMGVIFLLISIFYPFLARVRLYLNNTSTKN